MKPMKLSVKIFFVVMSILMLLPNLGFAQERIASWNIRNLGWNNDKAFQALGRIGAYFDLISVQEVMSEDGIEGFRRALEAETGANWDTSCSHLVGRGSYREMYCFTWRMDTITLEGGEAVFFDQRDVFAREPYSAIFSTASGVQLVATSVHAIYGDAVAQRQQEALALREYVDWLNESFPGLPVFLMGDFNLPPTNPAWAPVGEIMYPLIQQGATTLSTIDGRLANLYDNIWVPAGTSLPVVAAGRLEFPHQVLGVSHEEARDRVSDHIPVWVEVDGRSPGAVLAPHNPGGTVPQATRPASDTSANQRAGQGGDAVAMIIGNANSKIYHLPGCPHHSRVGAQNRVPFETEEEARGAGFRRAGNC